MAVLDRVGNYSDYVNKLVLQHATDWTESLALLRRRGWQAEELLAACDALGGHGLSNAGRGGAWIADELTRREREEACFRQRDVSAVRQRTCFEQLSEDDELARALTAIVREYWLGNADCQQAIRGGAKKR